MALLDENPLFAGLTPARRAALLAAAESKTFAPHDLILRTGEPSHSVFALEVGRTRVFHAGPSGGEIVVKVFGAPALFGEAEALAGVPYVESVAALTACDLIAIPADVFAELVREEHTVAASLCLDLAARLTIASYDEKSIAFDPATVRLANYLLDYASWLSDEHAELNVDQTQQEMANAIGVTRRSIAKDIALWQEEHILHRTAGGYRLVNPDGLRRYADADRLTLHYSLKRGLSPKR